MFRRRNSSGAALRARATILGVPGCSHGSLNGSTAAVHFGARSPAQLAIISAAAAARLATRALSTSGAAEIAISASAGWVRTQSVVALNIVQFGSTSPEAAAAAIVGIAGAWSMVNDEPAAPVSRCSIPIVESISPRSMRATVDAGTPARRARARCESPARPRAPARIVPAVPIVRAYMQRGEFSLARPQMRVHRPDRNSQFPVRQGLSEWCTNGARDSRERRKTARTAPDAPDSNTRSGHTRCTEQHAKDLVAAS